MPLKKSKLETLSKEESEEIDSALSELEHIEWTISSAEVAADNLAFCLKQSFLMRYPIGKKFRGKTSTLYEIIEALHDHYELAESAIESALEMKSALEDTYMEDDGDFDVVKEWADALGDDLRKFLEKFKTPE